MNNRFQEVWDQCKKFDKITTIHEATLDEHQTMIRELQHDMSEAKKKLYLHGEELTRLEYIKTDRDEFFRAKKQLELQALADGA